MIYVRKEGRKDIVAYEELYQELVQRYLECNQPSYMFEYEFIDERAWIPRAIASVKKQYLPSLERDYMDFFMKELCKMESDLLRLEFEVRLKRVNL